MKKIIIGSVVVVIMGVGLLAQSTKWYNITQSEEDYFTCIDGNPGAKLVAIYNANGSLDQYRCYPNGGVD